MHGKWFVIGCSFAVITLTALVSLTVLSSKNFQSLPFDRSEEVYTNCVPLFTSDILDIQCRGHSWKFSVPSELKTAIRMASVSYNSGDFPLSAQAIFGPVTVNIYRYPQDTFQIGFNNQNGEQRFWVNRILG